MEFNRNYKCWWYTPLCIGLVAFMFFRYITEPGIESRWDFKGVVARVKYYKRTPEVIINDKKYAPSLVLWDNEYIIHAGDTLIKHKGSKVFMCIKRNTRDTIYGRIHRYNNKDRERNRQEDARR